MNDSSVTPAQAPPDPAGWLLLIHQIPPKPDYFRVKVRRRLQRLGAVALKNSVYLLPRREDTIEDFEWLVHEIRAEGGEATLCSGSWLAGTTDEEVETMFRNERDTEYAALARQARELGQGAEPSDEELARLRGRLEEVQRIDFFGAPSRAEAERAVEEASRRGGPGGAAAGGPVRGGTWVTRRGIKVDRIASAWLIRRFIDPEASFRFVAAEGYRPAPGELRFDMYEGEFTHEGDRCTFETLLARYALDDAALHAIGEIVHDVDCKDAKFGRAEAAGVASLIGGLALAYPDDQARLDRGAPIFEGLYAYISAGARSRPTD